MSLNSHSFTRSLCLTLLLIPLILFTGSACNQDDGDSNIGSCKFFLDADGDGFGDASSSINPCAGSLSNALLAPDEPPTGYVRNRSDCEPVDGSHWWDCGLCADADGDDYGDLCDLGDDCDDTLATGGACTEACNTYFADADGDGAGSIAALINACSAPLGYVGTSGDCDDNAATGGACTTGCSVFYDDTDSDSYGDPASPRDACSLPGGFSGNNTDCNPASGQHWADCGVCVDVDVDGRGAGCDLGGDCNDGDNTIWTGCPGVCVDLDGDGYGPSCAPGPDCAPSDLQHWSDCGICIDADNDGYGAGCNLGADCDDSVATGASCFNTCATFFTDLDGDLFGDATSFVNTCSAPPGYVASNTDCAPLNPLVWTGCGPCVDLDGDGFGLNCALGGDCDDTIATGAGCNTTCSTFYLDTDLDFFGDPATDYTGCIAPTGYVANGSDCNPTSNAHWTDCLSCVDQDGDNYGAGCNLGADCDDTAGSGAACFNTCANFYADVDGDGFGSSTPSVNACSAPAGYVANNTDCAPNNANVWTGCGACVDLDGDGFGVNCALGGDCDDSVATGVGCNNTCVTTYSDVDLDGYGDPAISATGCTAPTGYVANGTDCAPASAAHWSDCGLCVDLDADTRGYNCNLGPDCDDSVATGAACFNTCANFFADQDTDTFGDAATSVNTCAAPIGYVTNNTDCAPLNPLVWTGCGACVDLDADGFGVNCALGGDCDDTVATGAGCHNTCVAYSSDADADLYGDPAVTITSCVAPPAYVSNNTDCNPLSGAHWSDCLTCVDADADTFGAGCNLGADCDDTLATGGGCNAGCSTWGSDGDADGFGDPATAFTGCIAPAAGYVANITDCNPLSGAHWSDCGLCVDNDLDQYGSLCNLGPDCDDTITTGTSCFNTCMNFFADADGDGYGDATALASACIQPTGYVANNTDCAPANAAIWTGCGLCVDLDGDSFGLNCAAGGDCDDTVATGAGCNNTCGSYYGDADADLYGDPAVAVTSCFQPASYTSNNLDCNPASSAHWTDCGTCVDTDLDGRGFGCNLGPDCDESVATGASCYNTCANFYADADLDGFGDQAVLANTCVAPAGYVANNTDCAPANALVWTGCGLCIDLDLDGYGVNCALGGDCDDTVATGATCNNTCTASYVDTDLDGYGDPAVAAIGCAAPAGYVGNNLDCNPLSAQHWTDCATCVDLDADGYGAGCNLGPDCDDAVLTGATCFNTCATFYADADLDGYGTPATTIAACVVPTGYAANLGDCDDSIATGATCYFGCANFYADVDGDLHAGLTNWVAACVAPVGYFTTADDCDDTVATGVGCWNTCTIYYQDADLDGFGDPAAMVSGCVLPAGYVANNTDCNPASNAHWADCAVCVDLDLDGYGPGCDLGPDCDDTVTTGLGCFNTCATFFGDADKDFVGDPTVTYFGCAAAPGFVASNTDCNPASGAHWADCGLCVDLDADNRGPACDLGPDCDDTAATGASCFNTCATFYLDADGDLWGDATVTTTGCVGPLGYVANNLDCAPAAAAHWNDCGVCVDFDADNYGVGCNLGADCDDSVATGATCFNTCTNLFADQDGDLLGDPATIVIGCAAGPGKAANSIDCAPLDPLVGAGCYVSFTASQTWGQAALTVQFTNTSSSVLNPVTGVLWDFGDATTSTAANPSHVYQSPGNYTVTLTVTNAFGSHVKSVANFVAVAPNDIIAWNNVALAACAANNLMAPDIGRLLSMMHGSMYDAINSITGTGEAYVAALMAPMGAYKEAAAAQAAYAILANAFPAQLASFDAQLATSLSYIPNDANRAAGIGVGQSAAEIMIMLRSMDGSGGGGMTMYTGGTAPGQWRPTPPGFQPGMYFDWQFVTPFALPSKDFFRPAPPPALTSVEYATDYNEVKDIGAAVSATRTPDQSAQAMFWATPPGSIMEAGQMNKAAQQATTQYNLNLEDASRMFALTNFAIADAAIAGLDCKYFYGFWRPITAIWDGDLDGNPATIGDLAWNSYIMAPAHPEYISTHSTITKAATLVMTRFLGTDVAAITLTHHTNPAITRSYSSFSSLADEVGLSRIYGGIHFRFSMTTGSQLGVKIANYVFGNFLRPLPACYDVDGDGFGVGCAAGPDCDDSAVTGASCNNTCASFYPDLDLDGHGAPVTAVNACVAPAGFAPDNLDCDDSVLTGGGCFNTCAPFYADVDADTFGDPAVSFTACVAPIGFVADSTDCDDSPLTGAACNITCSTSYPDADKDGFGNPLGLEVRCAVPYGYVFNHTDCDDNPITGPTCNTGCVTYFSDLDLDTFGDPAVTRAACVAPTGFVLVGGDCAPLSGAHWNDCATCVDLDADNYGAGCNLGTDCDDSIATGATCFNTCASFYQDTDADLYGNPAVFVSTCMAPAGYVVDNTDCNALSAAHWNDCATCVDLDADGRGLGCNLGPDCDDTVATGAGCFTGCGTFYSDADGDSYGNPAMAVTACVAPATYVANNQDCDPANPLVWSGCPGWCVDLDLDGRGSYCTLGPDCDDTVATGAACFNTCTVFYMDADGDGFGDAAAPINACVQPVGYVINNTDCDPGNFFHFSDCPNVINSYNIPKFVTPLVIPPAMPYVTKTPTQTYYEIAARQFQQQVLPPGYPQTTVWGYVSKTNPAGTSHSPSFTIEARVNETVRVKWMNELVDASGNYLPHLFAIDQTLNWANPAGPPDSNGTSPLPYTGPVPITTHVHGIHTESVSDGIPDSWYLPAANNIPAGYFTQGTYYGTVAATPPGSAIFQYPNNQRPGTIWYHDHGMGITRLNVYAGLAGFYLLRDPAEDALNLPGPSPKIGEAPGTKYYEVPLAIQDRTFLPDGSFFFPSSRAYFDGYLGPYFPDSDVPPIWNPEFFGNSMMVNGHTWPYLDVEPRKYRLRMLNGCNARTLVLKFSLPVNFSVIGKENLLPNAPSVQTQVVMMPGERNDAIVDFSAFPVGTTITMLNVGPDAPFGGVTSVWAPADPNSTGQVMQFRVIAPAGADTSLIPVALPPIAPLTTALPVRNVTLNEEMSMTAGIPIAAKLGTDDFGPLKYMDPTTETPALGATEQWNIYNLTVDAHPMHLHLVNFQIVERRAFDSVGYEAAQQAWLAGGKVGVMPNPATFEGLVSIPPLPWETGLMDTAIANPGEVLKIIATFDTAGVFVWHCHIVDHEDNEMMRRFEVGGIRGIPGATMAPPLTMNALSVPKFVEPLLIPPAMPYNSKDPTMTYYEIGMRQVTQQSLPTGFPTTTAWGYGNATIPGAIFNWPALTMEARANEKVRVKWMNELVDANGNYLPHLLPVDQTLHWANPPGPPDQMGLSMGTYTGPVPTVVHVHGAHVGPESDGYAEAWWLPNAANIPAGFTTQGTWYNSVIPTTPGAAVFDYPNDQPAGTVWYHDHAVGMTRLNVYAGLAGFWLIRDQIEDSLNLPGPAPKVGDAPGTKYYEIPLAIQDRSYKPDGQLFFPSSREYFDGYAGPYMPTTMVHAIWNPEFFGQMMTVNGKTWPFLEVEPKLYRFRLLNGCNARTLALQLDNPSINFTVIGKDGSFVPDVPVPVTQVIMGAGERYDVIVDFSTLPVGSQVIMLNVGPDAPFGGSNQGIPWVPANPATTGLVMMFKVVPSTGQQLANIPPVLPAMAPLTTTLPQRNLTLNEVMDMTAGIPIQMLLGTDTDGPLLWGDPVTENPVINTTEIWTFANLTVDAHPMHLHQVQFQLIDRTPFDAVGYDMAQQSWILGGKIGAKPDPYTFATGPAILPNPWEVGFQDTVLSDPGMITRVISHFDLLGRYIWHCHIVDHEDNEMMRPFDVVPACIDHDGDGRGIGCALGPDCDDSLASGSLCFSGCFNTWADQDADTFGNAALPVTSCIVHPGYVLNSTDCDDSPATGATCNTGCTTFYADGDGDGFGNPLFTYSGCVAPVGYVINNTDCNPASGAHWNDCATCVDLDADNYGTGCNLGPDCDDSVATGASCFNTCANFYQDADADLYGNPAVFVSACLAPAGYVVDNTDCNPLSSAHWTDCTSCVDLDADNYGVGCNLGTDCDDTVATGAGCFTGCATYYSDADADTFGDPAASTLACAQPLAYVTNNTDCNPLSAAHWNDCATCVDVDLDTFGAGCNLGTDCDDTIATGFTCNNTCALFYGDADGDGFGDPLTVATACIAPTGFVINKTDCNPASAAHWSDCGLCVDADLDGLGVNCNLGTDCDDSVATGASCFNTCQNFYSDADGDGFGDALLWLNACVAPVGFVADGTDCNPTTALHWSDCGLCVDLDLDGRGVNCNLGPDCDDTLATGAGCFNTCTVFYMDADVDGFGDAAAPINACLQPVGYVINNTDCDPGNFFHFSDCPNVINSYNIPKYVTPLVIPPAMPYVTQTPTQTYYEIAARQFQQQVLPPGYPQTTVWGYVSKTDPAGTSHSPSFTIEARVNEIVRVKWMNELVDASGNYLPHLFAIDQTLNWANPAGPPDSNGTSPLPYTGPVPITAHVHGIHAESVSDGLPDSWYLPAANNIPAGYFTQGTYYGTVAATLPGSAIFEYPNNQRPGTIWYHDHGMGITRLNVHAGLAGFYLLRDPAEDALNLPGPSPKIGEAPGTKYYEVPLAIQDRSFLPDGSFFFPSSRAYFDGYLGPYFPGSDVPPIWNPEFFGNSMMVNGHTWPYLDVEPRKYRLRLLNGCNARALVLKFDLPVNFSVIGKENLLPNAPTVQTQVVMMPGERNDAIVDFSAFPVGTTITMLNVGPDAPFGGVTSAWAPADPNSTGQVMQFRVIAPAGADTSLIPAALPPIAPLTTALPVRNLTLNEEMSMTAGIPIAAKLGTADFGPLKYMDPTTELPALNTTEQWNIYNLTVDAHPMHLHLVNFQIVERRAFDNVGYEAAQQAWLAGGKVGVMPNPATFEGLVSIPPLPWETGLMDTAIANPGQVLKIIAKFDLLGRYVWHCHIVDHEDNEMMRPFQVVP